MERRWICEHRWQGVAGLIATGIGLFGLLWGGVGSGVEGTFLGGSGVLCDGYRIL